MTKATGQLLMGLMTTGRKQKAWASVAGQGQQMKTGGNWERKGINPNCLKVDGRQWETSRCSLLSIASGLDCRSEGGGGRREMEHKGQSIQSHWKTVGEQQVLTVEHCIRVGLQV